MFVKGRFGPGIERDLHFVARFPLSLYIAACCHQRIVESEAALTAMAWELGRGCDGQGGQPALWRPLYLGWPRRSRERARRPLRRDAPVG